MKKVYYNKLIRDKIPEKIIRKGEKLEARVVEEEEFRKELLKKVGEEASGLLSVKSNDEIVAELADVLDVIEEVKKTFSLSDEDIEKMREYNNEKKGGFDKKLFLVWSSDSGYKTNETRYRK